MNPNGARSPRQSSATLNLFERIGRPVQALGVPHADQFTSAMALVNYILGVGSQNAANARMADAGTNREQFLAATATAWAELDTDMYAFTRAMAGLLRDHDDRDEVLAGIDLILAGLNAPKRPGRRRLLRAT